MKLLNKLLIVQSKERRCSINSYIKHQKHKLVCASNPTGSFQISSRTCCRFVQYLKDWFGTTAVFLSPSDWLASQKIEDPSRRPRQHRNSHPSARALWLARSERNYFWSQHLYHSKTLSIQNLLQHLYCYPSKIVFYLQLQVAVRASNNKQLTSCRTSS